MRHAKAVRDHEAPSDAARGLTERGREDARRAAEEMRAQGIAFDTVLASTAARTMATARLVMECFPQTPRLVPDDALYLAEPGVIWSAARSRLEAGGVLLVGHNPGLHELVAGWIARAGDRSRLALSLTDGVPTAAWAAFDVEDAPAESLSPRLLGGWAPNGL